jgi:hypothetical protein
VAIPLEAAPTVGAPFDFYTFEGDAWVRIAEAEVCVGEDCGIGGAPAVAQATFDPIPSNLVALIEDQS